MLYVSVVFLTSRTLPTSLAEALPEHPEQEEGVADQVASPQTAGLDDETRQPLEAVVREQARAAAQPAGDVVEDGPAREGDAGVYACACSPSASVPGGASPGRR